MHPQFRFPRSVIVLMALVFVGVVLTIDKLRSLAVSNTAGEQWTFAVTPFFAALFIGFVLMCITGALGFAVVFTVRRYGRKLRRAP